MTLPKITFNRGQGGLGRPLPNNDHISGIIFYFALANLPTGWATAWVTVTDYVVGDTVTESTTLYRCLEAHTSGTFATDLAADKWVADNTTRTRVEIVYSIEELEDLGVAEGAANVSVLWYHVNEYFRMQPKGKLYIYLADATSIDYDEHGELQTFAGGEIRQIGIYDGATPYASANIVIMQTESTLMEGRDEPASILYAADFTAETLSTIDDIRALASKNISVVLGEDGDNDGAALAVSEGTSITVLGAALGAISFAKVHENIGWVNKFNLVDGLELDVPAMADGSLVKTLSASLLDALNDKGYIFIKKHKGIAGSYFNDAPTSIALTNDFAYVENNRTIDKAVRQVRTFMLPYINSPLLVNNDGTLTEDTIARFKNDSDRALEQMAVDGEISAYETLIDPSQDVLSTSEIIITLNIVPVGVARQITINIGFKVNLR